MDNAVIADTDREYLEAECTEPHPDGSVCNPSWDGYGFVCVNRIIRERDKI